MILGGGDWGDDKNQQALNLMVWNDDSLTSLSLSILWEPRYSLRERNTTGHTIANAFILDSTASRSVLVINDYWWAIYSWWDYSNL